MTAPAKRVRALPAPQLVSLVHGPYADSPDGWWTQYGGALDTRSGVVHLPQVAQLPPCPFPCMLCAGRTDSA